MPKTLAQFWSELPISPSALYIHADDLQWFHKKQWDAHDQSPISFDKFIRGNRFGKDDKQLHLSLLPLPFIGNLENADIFILLMNPGFSPSDYYAEENPAFRAACISNLHQSKNNDEFPFFYLNPQFAWSGGFMWWETRLRPILLKLMEIQKFSTYYESLAFLAKRIAAVELVPYHSVGGSALKGPGKPWKNLPSAVAAKQFVQGLYRSSKQPLIVVARSHEKWDIPELGKPNVVICPRTRGITFNPELPAGRKVLEHLGYSTLAH